MPWRVAAAGGDVYLDGARADLLPIALDVLRGAGSSRSAKRTAAFGVDKKWSPA